MAQIKIYYCIEYNNYNSWNTVTNECQKIDKGNWFYFMCLQMHWVWKNTVFLPKFLTNYTTGSDLHLLSKITYSSINWQWIFINTLHIMVLVYKTTIFTYIKIIWHPHRPRTSRPTWISWGHKWLQKKRTFKI